MSYKNKWRRIVLQEHVVNDSNDEPTPPVIHCHTHIEVIDGQATGKHMLYTMPVPSSPAADNRIGIKSESFSRSEHVVAELDTEAHLGETDAQEDGNQV